MRGHHSQRQLYIFIHFFFLGGGVTVGGFGFRPTIGWLFFWWFLFRVFISGWLLSGGLLSRVFISGWLLSGGGFCQGGLSLGGFCMGGGGFCRGGLSLGGFCGGWGGAFFCTPD